MNDIGTLENLWSKVRQTREVDNFYYSLLEPGKFCLHLHDERGQFPAERLSSPLGSSMTYGMCCHITDLPRFRGSCIGTAVLERTR